MTRQDYELIARALVLAQVGASEAQKQGVRFAAQELAAQLARENAKFDKVRFLAASQVVRR